MFFANSSAIIAFVATQHLCRSAVCTKTPCGVKYVACHVQVAFLLSCLSPPWCQWRPDWSALGGSATVAFGLRLFVARFWLADVGSGVRCKSTWSVLLSVVAGPGDTLWPVRTSGRKQVVSSRH